MKKTAALKTVFIIFIILAALALIYFSFVKLMPELIPLLRDGDENEIAEYLKSRDASIGLLCTALLQMVQVFSIVIPAMPIQLAAGMVYGTYKSFFVCHLASLLANFIVFLFARGLKTSLSKKDSSRFDFLLKSTHPSYNTFIAYLLPLLPNGIIPYVCAKTKIKALPFVLCVYFGSFFSVLIPCSIGSKLINGGYIGAALLIVILFLISFLLAKFKNQVLAFLLKCKNRFTKNKDA